MLRNITPNAYRCFGGLGCPAVFLSKTYQDITPEKYKCPPFGACPAVFVKKEIIDITPDIYRCGVGLCPRVFSGEDLVYLVGKKVDRGSDEELQIISVGENEALVSLSLDFMKAVKFPE